MTAPEGTVHECAEANRLRLAIPLPEGWVYNTAYFSALGYVETSGHPSLRVGEPTEAGMLGPVLEVFAHVYAPFVGCVGKRCWLEGMAANGTMTATRIVVELDGVQ